MSMIELTKLHFSEIKENICVELGVMSSENYIALQCSNNQLIIFDSLDPSAVLTDFPYNLHYAEIPQKDNISSLKKNDLKQVYINCNLLEQHRLALEALCASHFSCELTKVNALQFKRASWQPIAVIVTANGLCLILKKAAAPSRYWRKIFNVNEIFSMDTLLSKSDGLVKNSLNKSFKSCFITAASWHKTEPVLFVCFENGCVAILKFCSVHLEKLKEFLIATTTLEKIRDIISFDNYLLLSCRDGILQLFSINYKTKNLDILSPLEAVWNKRDNMVCNNIRVNKFSHSLYLVVFNKGSHILVVVLSAKGKIICFKKLQIRGIKVTGLEFISSCEFLVTTITSTVQYFRVDFLDNAPLRICKQAVKTDLDSSNLGILGLAPSCNNSILTFILFRNGEYSQQSKYMHNSIFINVSKLERFGCPQQHTNLRLGEINQSDDLMDMFCNINYDNYSPFSDILNTKVPVTLGEGFLLQLQMKFAHVTNFLSFQRRMQKQNKESTIIAHKFLSIAIQIMHVICRLKYLHSLDALTSFQQESLNLFVTTYNNLMLKLKSYLPHKHILEQTRDAYLNMFIKSYFTKRDTRWSERCLYCNDLTNPNTMMCENKHKVKRCFISYTQQSKGDSFSKSVCCAHAQDFYVLASVNTCDKPIKASLTYLQLRQKINVKRVASL